MTLNRDVGLCEGFFVAQGFQFLIPIFLSSDHPRPTPPLPTPSQTLMGMLPILMVMAHSRTSQPMPPLLRLIPIQTMQLDRTPIIDPCQPPIPRSHRCSLVNMASNGQVGVLITLLLNVVEKLSKLFLQSLLWSVLLQYPLLKQCCELAVFSTSCCCDSMDI